MTNPKKNRKIFNIVLAIVLAVGVWLYVINVENPSGTGTVREIPVTVVGEDSLAEQGLMVTEPGSCLAQTLWAKKDPDEAQSEKHHPEAGCLFDYLRGRAHAEL